MVSESLPSSQGDPHLKEVDVTTTEVGALLTGPAGSSGNDSARAAFERRLVLPFERGQSENLTFDFDFHVLTPKKQTKEAPALTRLKL